MPEKRIFTCDYVGCNKELEDSNIVKITLEDAYGDDDIKREFNNEKLYLCNKHYKLFKKDYLQNLE